MSAQKLTTPTIVVASGQEYLTDRQRWQAVKRRDRRADGSFVYAVRTTGVYCRPSCGARLALRENVRFHDSCAAAERAGFRPCKRCRPAALPADETRTDARLVIRACREIETADHPPSLAALAAAADMTAARFRRLFKSTTGLTPKAYAAAQRALQLRQALSAGESVTTAALRAGFRSHSRLYAAAKKSLGMKPAAYRAGGAGAVIRYASATCWLGRILVASTDQGICAISLADDLPTLVNELVQRFPRATRVADDRRLAALLARVIRRVNQPAATGDLPFDLQGTAFQHRVWQALCAVPAGETITYTALAQRLGQPSAMRAVASACAANPVAVVVPCHRAVRRDGSLAGYRWGLQRKRALLEREQTAAAKKSASSGKRLT